MQILYAFNNASDAQRTYREAGGFHLISSRYGKVSYLMEFGGHTNILYAGLTMDGMSRSGA